MATATDEKTETTVEFNVDGEKVGPVNADQLDEAMHRLRAEEAHSRREKRLGEQLSFDTGASRAATPDFATLKIAGNLGVDRDLRYQEHVTVTVTDAHGELVATSTATVGWPAFKDKTTGELTFTERAHTATLD